MRISLDFLKSRKLYPLAFLFCSMLLFLPDSLLRFIGLDLIGNTFFIKTLIGIIWLICLLVILCRSQIKFTPIFLKFLCEWGLVFRGLFRPHVFIPLGLTIGALYVANLPDIDKRLSFLLQIIAILTTALASAFFYDVIKDVLGNDVLVKKGQSAVRNLSLARLKTKNLFDRVKEKASAEEIQNLLSLLEKDIANATQEWNDILPGVIKIEEIYNLLSEKEKDLELTRKEKERLDKKLAEERRLTDAEKDDLKKNLCEKKKRIDELLDEIDKLRVTTDSVPYSALGVLGKVTDMYSLRVSDYPSHIKKCSICGKSYSVTLGDLALGVVGAFDVCKKCRSDSK